MLLASVSLFVQCGSLSLKVKIWDYSLDVFEGNAIRYHNVNAGGREKSS